MGIEHIITCDQCKRVINSNEEDYGSIEVNMEIDANQANHRDERHRLFGIYCLDCFPGLKDTFSTIIKSNN